MPAVAARRGPRVVWFRGSRSSPARRAVRDMPRGRPLRYRVTVRRLPTRAPAPSASHIWDRRMATRRRYALRVYDDVVGWDEEQLDVGRALAIGRGNFSSGHHPSAVMYPGCHDHRPVSRKRSPSATATESRYVVRKSSRSTRSRHSRRRERARLWCVSDSRADGRQAPWAQVHTAGRRRAGRQPSLRGSCDCARIVGTLGEDRYKSSGAVDEFAAGCHAQQCTTRPPRPQWATRGAS